ncbi:hypothetical protein FNF29_00255 [Cafeteria roenbergensis]|uniref:START domain-containing protein n=2 Tax=Cafeteria roenbergensis TaxID=33653 RepID=A0A5A8CZZ0_CAFRO|nr:hypothetical protein FNF29_00255 [Cafeteria roenbergensis]|eukprot:KAA0157680.1 hypothetical protein FNF29_00255 [Cafeteria roenbergensis]
MPDPCAVVLLNGSLRLDDNPLLEHVAGAACVPFATQEWAGCPATAPWERGVFDALDERLEALCSGLAVMKGGDVSHAAFRELVAAAGATTLLVGEERSGLDELRKLAAAAGIEAKLVACAGPGEMSCVRMALSLAAVERRERGDDSTLAGALVSAVESPDGLPSELLWREERERFAARVASKSAELSFADRGRLCAKALALGGWKAALHHVAEGAATPADLSAGTPAALCGAAPGTVDLLASGLSSCLLLGAAAVRQALTWDEYCRRRVDRRPADAAVPERWMALHSLPWAGADGCLDGHGVPAWAPKSPLTASAGEWAAAAAVSGPAAIGDAMAVVSRAFAAADATAADQRAEATSAAVASMPARAAWLASGRTGYPAVDAAVRCAASCGLLSADLQTLVIVHACQYMHLPWQAAVRWLAGLLVGGAALLPALAVRAQWSLGLLLEPEAPASHPHQMADPAAGRFARHRDPSGRFAAAWCPELDAAGIPEHWRYAPFSSGARCQPAGGAPGTPDAAGGSDAAVAPKLVPHPAHWDPTLASAAPTDSARAASEAPTDAEALLAVGATTLLRPCVSRPRARKAVLSHVMAAYRSGAAAERRALRRAAEREAAQAAPASSPGSEPAAAAAAVPPSHRGGAAAAAAAGAGSPQSSGWGSVGAWFHAAAPHADAGSSSSSSPAATAKSAAKGAAAARGAGTPAWEGAAPSRADRLKALRDGFGPEARRILAARRGGDGASTASAGSECPVSDSASASCRTSDSLGDADTGATAAGRPADSFAAMQADGPWLEASSGWRLREVHPDAAAWGVSVDSTDGAPLPLLVEEDAALVFEMSDADALGHGWTQTIDDPSSELRAWMRPSEENPAIRKGAAIFTSHGLPASAVAAVIADLELYTLWDRSWADVRPVRRINDDNEALYFVTQTPPVPFVQARDFPMVRHVMSDNERGEHVIMFRSAEHELCPPRKNHTRGLTLGVIGFTVQDVPTAAGEPPACRVSFVTAADARGNIPAWIINFIGKSLPVSWRDTCSTAAREAFLA